MLKQLSVLVAVAALSSTACYSESIAASFKELAISGSHAAALAGIFAYAGAPEPSGVGLIAVALVLLPLAVVRRFRS